MAKHTCPNCKHVFSDAPKPKKSKNGAQVYTYAEVVFADGVSVLRGTYTGSKDHVAEGAIHMRALSLSGGRFLDRACLGAVPSVETVTWLLPNEVEEVRNFAFDQRENLKDGWGRNLTDLSLMSARKGVPSPRKRKAKCH